MKTKNYITGLIITMLLNILVMEQEALARMVFIKDEGATDADIFVLDADDSNASDIQLQF